MTPTATLTPQVVEQIVTRAGRPDFDRWADHLGSTPRLKEALDAFPWEESDRMVVDEQRGMLIAVRTTAEDSRVVALVLGVVFRDDEVAPIAIAGVALVLVGAILAGRREKTAVLAGD